MQRQADAGKHQSDQVGFPVRRDQRQRACRHRLPGSVAFWGNRCVQHNPVNGYRGFRRVMNRITLAGDAPK